MHQNLPTSRILVGYMIVKSQFVQHSIVNGSNICPVSYQISTGYSSHQIVTWVTSILRRDKKGLKLYPSMVGMMASCRGNFNFTDY